jgi:glycosyltransferase involved in cell wall biosynthesis
MIDASGVGVYLRECLPFFLDSENLFFLVGDAAKLRPVVSDKKNAEIAECRAKPFSVRELTAFPRNILQKINKTDLYYSPYFNIPGGIRIPVYTTIHDIIFPDMPELTSKAGLAARMWFYRRAFRRSKKIFTVSEFSKSRIELYSRNSVPVIVTHSAIRPCLLKGGYSAASKKNSILFIGNLKKHKGLGVLLDAFLAARDEGLRYKLVIAGGGDNFRSRDTELLKKTDSAAAGGTIAFTGFIPDEALGKLLGEAALLVQPSLYEGFCLPPLEAMTAGTQALVSDIPALKEIYRDYPVIWFKAGDSEDLRNKLMELLHNRKPAAVKLSRDLAGRYTFAKTSSIIMRELTGREA